MTASKVKIEKIYHRGKDRIAVRVPYGSEYIQEIKQIAGARWSQTNKCWHIPYSNGSFRALKSILGPVITYTPKSSSEPINPKQDSTSTQDSIILTKESRWRINAEVPYYRKDWIARIKQIPGKTWDPETKHWSVPYTRTTIKLLKHQFSKHLDFQFKIATNIPEDYNPIRKPRKSNSKKPKLPKGIENALFSIKEQLLYERRSYSTIKAYLSCATKLFLHYQNVTPEKITDDQIKDYLISRIKKNKISVSSQNQFINALKVYYHRVLHQERALLDLRRPKKPNQLPHILSQNEVVRILSTVENLKHKCILMLVYSAGLRVSEVINLKLKDIDSNRMQIFIKGGKGKKDRYTILSKKTLILLREYFKQYRPFDWLFEGMYGGKYSTRSVQNIFQKACQKARIQKRPTLHTLRHSFATHLLEKGINLRYIQALLGHESSTTTEIYTHVTKQSINHIESPLDGLDI